MTVTTDTVAEESTPVHFRKQMGKAKQKLRALTNEIEHLRKMVLLQRINEMSLDMNDAVEVLDMYRPEFPDADAPELYDNFYSKQSISEWLAAR